MNEKINAIARQIKNKGGTLFLVGGAVRDMFRGVEPKDFDFMIQGITEKTAKDIIRKFGSVKEADVISNAPVFIARIDGEDFEFAMARIEIDTAPGKSGFEFISNPDVTVMDDLIRRDFTIGAIAQDVITREFIDPFNGVQDIKDKVIRAVDPKTFVQSPERAFRAFSQAARFNFDIELDTKWLIFDMLDTASTIPNEQIWRHFEKFGNGSVAPDRFIGEIVLCNWIKVFPEIHPEQAFKASRTLRGTKFDVCDVLAAIMAGMSFIEEQSFRARICAPKAIFNKAVEIKEFGSEGKPKKWVEGRDIAHVVPPGEAMGFWVRWCFIGQINGMFENKEDAVCWVKDSVEES